MLSDLANCFQLGATMHKYYQLSLSVICTALTIADSLAAGPTIEEQHISPSRKFNPGDVVRNPKLEGLSTNRRGMSCHIVLGNEFFQFYSTNTSGKTLPKGTTVYAKLGPVTSHQPITTALAPGASFGMAGGQRIQIDGYSSDCKSWAIIP
jgi:hypothetical protein